MNPRPSYRIRRLLATPLAPPAEDTSMTIAAIIAASAFALWLGVNIAALPAHQCPPGRPPMTDPNELFPDVDLNLDLNVEEISPGEWIIGAADSDKPLTNKQARGVIIAYLAFVKLAKQRLEQ